MNELTLLDEECGGCPHVYSVSFANGTLGYVRFRWGYISLHKNNGDEIIGEQISDNYDGIIERSKVAVWLQRQGYIVHQI